MEITTQNFGRDELVSLQLRGLFEERGFQRIRTGRFEEYALYVENRNFLDTESIITFMDLDGRLMSLKPDVTLSIIKHMPKKAMPVARKLYYIDEVYRLSPENREYKVHSQVGVELLGGADGFSTLEVIDLAMESLELISPRFVLDISHLGFVSGLLDSLALSHRDKTRLLENIHAKNTWDIARLLEQAGVPREQAERVYALAAVHGSFHGCLEEVRGLICNHRMQQAWEELQQVGTVINGCHPAGSVNLDFSVVNDLDYYNGLIFRGYVEGVPSLVLTGGRYDNLMKRMGKESSAIGFAVSLDDLNTWLKTGRQYDFDLLITYPADCDFPALLRLMREQCARGRQVRLEREDSDLAAATFTWRQQMRYRNGSLEEVESC